MKKDIITVKIPRGEPTPSVGGADFTPINNQKYPDHICRFNDYPQSCECYEKGRTDALTNKSYDKDFKEFDDLWSDTNNLEDYITYERRDKIKSYILSREKALIGQIREWAENMKKETDKARSMMLTKSGNNWKKAKKRVVGANIVLSSLLTYLDTLSKTENDKLTN